MNIVFFVSGLNSGGIENYLLRFLKYKHKSFATIYVYCKSGKDGQLEKEYLKIFNIVIIKERIGYLDNKSISELKKFYLEKQIDAVCDFTGNFAGRILKAAKNVGIQKRISFYRGARDHFKKDPMRSLYNKWVKSLVYKNATNILSNSKDAFNYFYPKVWQKDYRFEVIYNGIDSAPFINETDDLRDELGIPKNAFVIGHTGRYNEAKNHKTIINVAEILTKDKNDIYFILCGNGVRANLQLELNNRSLDGERILIFENRSDIPKFLKTMDCYFFPSITEGQPNALIEALVSGLPIIASNIEPIKETTPQLAHKYLKNPTDTQGYIEEIKKIYKSKEYASFHIYKEWAIKNFNYKEKFEEFYKIIIE